MKAVRYTADAAKSLWRHANVAPNIRRAISDYATDGASHANNVRPLVKSPAKRLRVGDFRIIFEETATEILVTRITPRSSGYE